jgi:general secretion pathway protein L
MNSFHDLIEAASRWIDRIAATIVEAIDCLRPKRFFQLVEQEDGSFLLQGDMQSEALDLPSESIKIFDGQIDTASSAKLAEILRGGQIEIVLRPKHFMFRLLELPRRASEFLDGIVRAQIDRLTPWSIRDAAVGWYPSAESSNDRMAVIIAATANTLIAPFVHAISALGVDRVVVSAALDKPRPDVSVIKISEHIIGQAAYLRRVRRVLVGLLVAAGILSTVSILSNVIVGNAIEAQREDVMRRVAERRAAIKSGHDKTSAAALELEQHKQEVPSSVIILEALSRILPDDTYLTELRILGDKVQIVGMTHDAPALIRLIEQTSHFTRANFFAPTTRSKTESAEHFSIEAHIEPVYAPDR